MSSKSSWLLLSCCFDCSYRCLCLCVCLRTLWPSLTPLTFSGLLLFGAACEASCILEFRPVVSCFGPNTAPSTAINLGIWKGSNGTPSAFNPASGWNTPQGVEQNAGTCMCFNLNHCRSVKDRSGIRDREYRGLSSSYWWWIAPWNCTFVLCLRSRRVDFLL